MKLFIAQFMNPTYRNEDQEDFLIKATLSITPENDLSQNWKVTNRSEWLISLHEAIIEMKL